MTPAQNKRLEELLSNIKSLVGDIEEDAKDEGHQEGYKLACQTRDGEPVNGYPD
jgi:hypothetical protein